MTNIVYFGEPDSSSTDTSTTESSTTDSLSEPDISSEEERRRRVARNKLQKYKDDLRKKSEDRKHQVSVSKGPLASHQSKSVPPIQILIKATDSKGQLSRKNPKPQSGSHPSQSITGNQGSTVTATEKLKDVKVSKEKGIASLESNEPFLSVLEKNRFKRFSQEELKKFTSGFAKKLGSGGFGNVYKGTFSDGTKIAVKVLVKNDFIQETFEAETSSNKAVVYEYMKNGSLDTILYGNPRKLEWNKFYKISIKVAKGLSYLHDGCDHQIFHHDLKPANVLLDKNFSAKISDFGLARHMDRNLSHVTWTKFRGTTGYVAPEMFMPSSEITHKCDVCSFGMRRNGEASDWFPRQVCLKLEKGKLHQIIHDSGIHKKEDRANAETLAKVALWCAQFTAQARPPMRSVVKMLEGEIQVMKPPNPFLPASEMLYSKPSSSHSINKSVHENKKNIPRVEASNPDTSKQQLEKASRNSKSNKTGKSKLW